MSVHEMSTNFQELVSNSLTNVTELEVGNKKDN